MIQIPIPHIRRAQRSRAHSVGPTRRDWLRKLDQQRRRIRRGVKASVGLLEPLRIDFYGGYAGNERAFVWGRALENAIPSAPRPDDTALSNLKRSLRQLRSDEVPGLALEVHACAAELQLRTDDEGYFCAELALPQAPGAGFCPARVRVVDDTLKKAKDVTAQAQVLVPGSNARFGVVSDIDDTILRSHVRNRLRQAYLTLFGNAITRLSFEHTPELYQGIARAGAGAPFFYVSRSAWNIHALLDHFIREKGFPPGPLVLRDVALFNQPEKRHGHKRREIERVFATYPGLPFLLIGDSGQADPTIYADVAAAHPGRVTAILIRDVSPPGRAQTLRAMFSERDLSERFLLFRQADEAQRWCRSRGLWA